MLLRDTPIQRKLVVIILLTTALALLLMRSAFFVFEYLTFREATLRQSETLARVIAANSTAVLTFGDEHDAEETLSAFKAEGSLVVAALYDEGGNLFSYYPTNLPPAALPEKPLPDGFQFGGSYLTGFEPVAEKGERKGTLYLKFDTGTVMREWLRVSGLIGIGVISAVLLATFLFSRRLQQQISQPILALAELARAVSTRRDYSVRARNLGGDEVGLLTDAFNQMLTEIQEQNQALGESEARVRSVLDSALSAVVVIDATGLITDWNARAETVFGWTRAEALGLVLAETIIPVRFREAHRRGLEHYLRTGEGPVLNKPIEMTALRRDGTEFPVELSISPILNWPSPPPPPSPQAHRVRGEVWRGERAKNFAAWWRFVVSSPTSPSASDRRKCARGSWPSWSRPTMPFSARRWRAASRVGIPARKSFSVTRPKKSSAGRWRCSFRRNGCRKKPRS